MSVHVSVYGVCNMIPSIDICYIISCIGVCSLIPIPICSLIPIPSDGLRRHGMMCNFLLGDYT